MYKIQQSEEMGTSPMASYVALPMDILRNNCDTTLDEIHLIIKSIPPGTICLLDASNLITNDCLIDDVNNLMNQTGPVMKADDASVVTTSDSTAHKESTNADTDLPTGLNGIEVVNPNETTIRSANRPSCFSCIFCKEEFSKLSVYRKHMLWHRNLKKFRCDKCSAEFNVESNYRLHMAVHDGQIYRCPACNIDFQRVASLKSHLLLHQVEEMYTCDECQAEFEKEEDLLKHNLSHMKDVKEHEEMVCTYCKMPCEDVVSYKEHISLHVKVKKVMLKGKKPRRTQGNKQYNHVCKTCNKTFPKVSLLERHERIHSGEKPFVCHICKKGFNQKGTLQVHLSKHSGIKPFECTLCPAKFNQRGNLRVHVEKTHMATIPGEKTYRCPQCSCIFKKLGSLNGHMTKMHSNVHHDIDVVMKQLNELRQQAEDGQALTKELNDDPLESQESNGSETTDRVANEVRGEDDTVTAPCSYVKLTESGADGNLRRYLIKHRKTGDVCYYMCNYCSKDFKKPSDLIRHIRVHTREKPYKCSKCSSAFSLKSTLIAHMNTHNTVKNLTCGLCPKQFSSTRTYSIHLRKHQKGCVSKALVQHYKCDICFKSFKTSEALESHSVEHRNGDIRINHLDLVKEQPLVQTDEGLLPVAVPRSKLPYIDTNEKKNVRPHQCQVCSAAFKKNVHLKRHMMAHNGDKRYKCPNCSKAFYTGSSLKEHMKFHMGIKNHVCKICGKKFVTLSLLKRHYVSHSSNKPYVCPHCDKRFKSIMVCRKHIRIHKKDTNQQQISNPEENAQMHGENVLGIENIVTFPVSLQEQSFTLVNLPSASSNDVDVDQNAALSNLINAKRKFLRSAKNQRSVLKTSVNATMGNSVLLEDMTAQPLQAVEQANDSLSRADLVLTGTDTSQKIFINRGDLQLTENVNLQSVCPQLKLHGSDPLFLSSLNDLQDSSILFSMDTLATELGPSTTSEMFTASTTQTYRVARERQPRSEDEDSQVDRDACTSRPPPQQQQHAMQEGLLIDGSIGLYPNITFATTPANNGDMPLSVDILTDDNGDLLASSFDLRGGGGGGDDAALVSFRAGDLRDADDCGETVDDEMDVTSFLCTDCMEVFVSLDAFQDHTCVVRGKQQSSCETAAAAAPATNEASDEAHDPVVASSCTAGSSGKTLENVQELRTPTKRDHNGKAKHACTFCEKAFQKPSDLNRHLRTHTGERPFACTVCDKKFSLKSTLETHYRVHNPAAKQYKCEVCNAFFTTKTTLKVHLYIHTGKKPYQCGSCTMKFRTLAHRRAHEATKHDPANPRKSVPKPKIMDILLASVSIDDEGQENIILQSNASSGQNTIDPNQNNVYAHVEDFQVQNALQIRDSSRVQGDCELQSSDIIIPEDSISSNRNIFILEDGTLINLKGATDMSPEMSELLIPMTAAVASNGQTAKTSKHECPICQKKYSTKVVLKKHLKTHQENKKFPCTKCSRGFDVEEDLDIHLKTHLGIRPYSCLYCSNSFAEEQNLKSHMKRLHGQVLTNDFTWDQIDLI